MSTITQFQFDIFPESCPEQGFSLLYGYVFQGILMKWIKNMDPTLAENLHKMKDEDGNTLKRLYSIQYKRIMKRNPHYQQPRTISNKNKERGPHRKMGDNEVVEINNNGLDQVDESIRKGSSCKRAGQSNRADQGNKVGGPNRKPRDTSRINAHTKRGDQSRKLNPKYHRGVRFTVNSANNELSRALFKLHLN